MPKKLCSDDERREFGNMVFKQNLSLAEGRKVAEEWFDVTGVSDSFVRDSLTLVGRFFDWKGKEHLRRSKVMRGNKNGEHPPIPLLCKRRLARAIRNEKTKEEMKQMFGVSDFLLERNLEWHGLQRHTRLIRDTVYKADGGAYRLRELAEHFGFDGYEEALRKKEPTVDDYNKFRGFLRSMIFAVEHLKGLARRVRDRVGEPNMLTVTSNYGECVFEELILPVCQQRGWDLQSQKVLSDEIGEVYFDFYIPQIKTLVEVNGSYHLTSTGKTVDARKAQIARKKRLKLVAISRSGKTIEEMNRVVERLANL